MTPKELLGTRKDYEAHAARMRANRSDNTGKKYKKRREKGPQVTPETLAAACRGSLGIIRRIARRLGVRSQSVRNALVRPGFELGLAAFREETEGMLNQACSTMSEMMLQRDEYKTALRASEFVLERIGKNRGWRTEVTIQGGDTPLRLEHSTMVTLDPDELPLEVRRSLLEKIEVGEAPQDRPVIRPLRIV